MTLACPPVSCSDPATAQWQALLAQIASAHAPSSQNIQIRTLVLLPFVQLLPIAKQHWLAAHPSGLMPRFETTSSWAASLPPLTLGQTDYCQNMAQDSLQARALLAQTASTRDQADALYSPLLALCAELAPLAASCPPAQRPAWGQRWQRELPSLLPEGDFLNTERHLQALAAAWLGYSSFASDVLFSPEAGAQFEQLIVVQGLRPDPLSLSLAEFWQAQGKGIQQLLFAPDLLPDAADSTPSTLTPKNQPATLPLLYACADGQALLAHSAKQVLHYLAQGQRPVALLAQDRLITRQLRAMLEAQGARIKDESGWKLSTTHAAGKLISLLQAALQPQDNSAQLAWLKACLPADAPELALLQTLLARAHTTLADAPAAQQHLHKRASRLAPAEQVQAMLALLEHIHSLHQTLHTGARLGITLWQERLHQALQLLGLHTQLMRDEAGTQILRLLLQSQTHPRPLSLAAFSAWLRDVLENAHFLSPSAPNEADVVILAPSQILGRSFAATVWPGVDAQRLPLLPKSSSSLSPSQRLALGLASATALAAAQQQLFDLVLQQNQLCLLWQVGEGELKLEPSPLLRAWQQTHGLTTSPLPELDWQERPAQASAPPQAQAGALRLKHISASAYSSLRACPYQFFSQRLLGLQASEELEQDPSSSDWGDFVHATLLAFHQARTQAEHPELDTRALLERCAEAQMRQLQADLGSSSAAKLLPYRNSWPQLATQYLHWLAQDEAQGWIFSQGEWSPENPPSLALESSNTPLPLVGKIDRLDHRQDASGQQLRVLDYKTSSSQTLKQRVKNPYEDTQLPFYSLLLGAKAKALEQTAYLSLRESETSLIPQEHWQDAALALETGMRSDIDRIYAGAPMQALGSEESACQYCAARGLCRKGQWLTPELP